MYEQHFGLKKRPFHARATGASVFVGPQIAAAMAGLKKALQNNDAMATVSGPVGTGKTTLVLKALDAIAEKYKIIVIGRMRLQSNDVLELLLDELDVDAKPQGTIQKFNAFRRRLREFEESDTRIFIVVEDSARLGVDTLAEIEALTAADAGVSDGTSVVLMGDEALENLLTDAQLGRVQQRVRQRLKTAPLCAAELRGYLRHCFRLAGGDFEQMFESDAPALLHHLTGGIARVANTVLDAAMTTATEQGSPVVSSELLARVAENEFGLSAAGFDFAPPPPAEPPEAASTAAPAEADEPPESSAPEPVIVFADVSHEEDLPELIQDTLPDLQVLTPDTTENESPPVTEAEMPELTLETDSEPELPELTPDSEPKLPELTPDSEPEQASPGVDPAVDSVPAWDRDPTMAELKPDLAALEEAMAFTRSPEPAPLDTKQAVDSEPEADTSIPEITLDHAISQRIESQLIDEPGEISPPQPESADAPASNEETPAVEIAPEPVVDKKSQADGEMEKIAAELARAKSLEDVDDRMAETLFGEELSLVASQFITPPVAAESANEEIEAAVQTDQVVSEPVIADQQVSAANGTSADIEVTLQASSNGDDQGGMDLSASQRLKTVRALNADLHPSLREPETPAANDPPPAENSAPDSIEDQIDISMTQTMKALKMPVSASDDDEKEEANSKSGFFSRFKRS